MRARAWAVRYSASEPRGEIPSRRRGIAARGLDHAHDVFGDGLVEPHRLDVLLQRQHFLAGDHAGQRLERMAVVLAEEHLDLVAGVRVAERDAER